MADNRFAVIWLGQFGNAIARQLSQRGAEVIAIDIDEEAVKDIKDDVAYAVTLDATDVKALRSQNIQEMDAVVVSIGDNFEALLLCTVLLKELNVKRVIARANDQQQRMILEKLGLKEILSPENEVGSAVAERLLNPNIISTLMLPDDYEIVEIKTPPAIANRTIDDVGLRTKYNLNLITVKREFDMNVKGQTTREQHIIGVPGSDTILYETDTIIVFGQAKDINRFIDINR
ncbi:MAG: TrkA family potassium uptake protein [Bacteroidia bacterium]|nr:TrkA family potassium uptake protein [Bacteroidia bacterium]